MEEGIYHILYMSQTFETLKPPRFVTVFSDASNVCLEVLESIFLSGTYWTPRAKAIQCLGYEGEDGGPGDYTPGDSLEHPWSPGAKSVAVGDNFLKQFVMFRLHQVLEQQRL